MKALQFMPDYRLLSKLSTHYSDKPLNCYKTNPHIFYKKSHRHHT